MILNEFTMRTNEGGYDGYDCIVTDDEGNRHDVIARPSQHAGRTSIERFAYRALAGIAIAEKQTRMEKNKFGGEDEVEFFALVKDSFTGNRDEAVSACISEFGGSTGCPS